MNRTIYRLSTIAGFLLAAGPLAAQTAPLDLELGYRVVRVSGDNDEYRTQINERPGLLLRNVTFATTDFGGRTSSFVDHLRVDGSDLGAGPAGALRLEFGRAGLYAVHFSYRHADAFSALPDFANPFFPAVIPGQHTIDRVRDLYDAEMELFPGKLITPILGYTRNTYSGPGRTTYHVGQDEFALTSHLADLDQEFRGGIAFDAGPVTGRVVEGWRQFKETEHLTLAPGAGNGNNLSPVLGVPVDLTNLNRDNAIKTDTPSTSAVVTGRIGPRLRLVGSYQRASAEADTNESEGLAGSLVSFEISRFFAGLTETASTKSKATFWNAGGRAEFAIVDGLDLTAGYTRRHRWLDGFALVSDLYINTVTFAGQDPRNLLVLLQAQNAMDRTEDVYEASVAARALGPFALKAGWSQVKQDVNVTPDLSEIVVPGNQGGDFQRRVNAFNAGATYSKSGFTAGIDYRRERANNPIVRTDFLDRDRYRVRLAWNDATDHLRVSANGTRTGATNDLPGIGYDGRVREYGGEIEILPIKPLRAHVSASKYEATSNLLFRVPQDFSTDVSVHRERGTSYEGGLTLTLASLMLDGSYGRFENKGSYPFTIDRARASGEIPVTPGLGLVAEWMRDKYNDAAQDAGNLAKFAANRYGLYVRWRQ